MDSHKFSTLSAVERLKFLKEWEPELVTMLEGEDLKKLVANLIVYGVISRDTKVALESLDHSNLQPQLQVRYILQAISDGVSRRKEVLDLFLIALKMMRFSTTDRGDFTTDEDIYFKEAHVAVLANLLVEISHRWEELAVMLGLTSGQIGECQNCNNNRLKIYYVVKEWVTGGQKPPTLSRLKLALSTDMVGLPNVARKVAEMFGLKRVGKNRDENNGRNRRVEFSIVQQPSDTTVEHCKSALLGIKVFSTDLIKYQWKLNGNDLCESEVFAGVSKAVLYINCVGGPRMGQYSCSVSSGHTIENSRNISLRVKYSPVTEHFFKYYQASVEVPMDSWPPVTSCEFINLVLVTKSRTFKERYTYAIQGDMDDIIEDKTTVPYNSVFKRYDEGSLILVEGRPGSGKTTLMHKVAKDWSLKKNILWDSNIVLLVPLRKLGVSNRKITLCDMFELYAGDEKQASEFLSNVAKEKGKGLCVIIDGLDEYEHRNDKSTDIYKLIHRKLLPLSVTIVASRPIGTASLRRTDTFLNKLSHRFEVLGFTNDQIFKYIQSYFKDNSRMVASLQSYLTVHLNVLRMCYLPVHAAMICYLYNYFEDNIPQTETKIYEYFTQLTIQRKLSREDEDCEDIESLETLPEDINDFFRNVCNLAFNMTINAKQVVQHRGKKEFFLSNRNLSSDESSLGLVIVDRTAALCGFKDTYTFLHLTFQEFLAALHLARLEANEQLKIIMEYSSKSEFRMVLRFFCGMVNFKEKSCLLKFLMTNPKINMISKCQWAFESQQTEVYDSVLHYGATNSLKFSDHTFVPADFYSVAHVLSHSRYCATKLVFDDCTFTEQEIEVFMERINPEKLRSVKVLVYLKSNSQLSEYKGLNLLLKGMPFLEVLNLECTLAPSVEEVKSIFSGVLLPYLQSLKIGCPIVTDNDSFDFEVLKLGSAHTKQYVGFSDSQNYMDQCVECARFISECGSKTFLDPNNSLVFLCNASLKKASHMVFHNFSNTSEVVLTNCGVTDNDVELLAEPLKSWDILGALHLDFNRISDEGAKLLSRSLLATLNLRTFSIICNQISLTGALGLAKVLSGLRKLKIFDCRYNMIREEESQRVLLALNRINKFTMSPSFFFFALSSDESHALYNDDFYSKKWWKKLQTIMNTGSFSEKLEAMKCSRFVSHIHIFNESLKSEVDEFPLEQWQKYCDQCWCGNDVLSVKLKLCSVDEVVSLADGLKDCVHLNVLALSSICMGSCGAVAIADGLITCHSLQVLELQDNDITSHGALALAEALSCCHALKKLNLSGNQIECEGVKALVTGLKKCLNLYELNLERNYLCTHGAIAMAALLNVCNVLHTLDLRSNNVGTSGAIALASASKRSVCLRHLYLHNNGISISSHEKVKVHNPMVVKM